MKIHIKRKFIEIILMASVFLLLFSLFLFPKTSEIADAILPSGYVDTVKGNDWYVSEEYLDLATVKSIINRWRSSEIFDFASVEKDPVVVAVIDTGINYNHILFTGQYNEAGESVTTGYAPYDVLYRDANGELIAKNTVAKSSYDYSDVDWDIMDDVGSKHGTHVAGIVAALIHELDLERYIKIMPIKAGHPAANGSGGLFGLTAINDAIRYALENGADVVNMSFAADSSDYNVVSSDMAKRAVFVAAAGNGTSVVGSSGGRDSKNYKFYPAAGENVIGVMNYQIDKNNGTMSLNNSSNYGASYNICAPGTAIWAADGSTDDRYKMLNGTSMAAPVVSFAAALMEMKYRALSGGGDEICSSTQIADMIKAAYSKSIVKSGYSLPVLDMKMVVQGSGKPDATIMIDASARTQYLGRLGEIECTLVSILDDMQGTGDVTWYVNDAQVARGFTFKFKPPSAVGSYIIVAQWSYTNTEGFVESIEKTEEIRVEYLPVDGPTVSQMSYVISAKDGEMTDICKVAQTYTLSIPDIEFIDPTYVDSIVWYVNSNLVHIGKNYSFVPEKPGEYRFAVRINDQVRRFTVKVEEDKYDSDNVIAYVSFAILGALAIALAATVIAIVVKRSRAKQGGNFEK